MKTSSNKIEKKIKIAFNKLVKNIKKSAGKVEKILKLPFQSVRTHVLRSLIPLDKKAVGYVAHRGLSAEAPENTIRAFELAADRHFHAMETDIRRTKDGKLVLMHDESLQRMCGVDTKVGDLTYEELQAIPITGGNNSEKYKSDPKARTVPLLIDYLKICKDSGMVPMMELKDNWDVKEPLSYEYLQEIVRQVRSVMGDGDRPVIYVSFNLNSLIRMKKILKKEKLDQSTTLYHLVKNISKLDYFWYLKHGINLSLKGKANKLHNIHKAKAAGLKLVVWTVDDPDQARLYIREKVDWVASNRQLWKD